MGQAAEFVKATQYPVGSIEITQLQCHTHRIAHAAPDDKDTALVLGGGINHLLNPGDQ